MESEKRELWIDNLRALGVIGVITIHVSGSLVYQYAKVDMSFWWIGNFYDSLVRFSVPVFGMIMGATILRKEYTLTHFYLKRGSRLIPPFLFWAFVYLTYNYALRYWHGIPVSMVDTAHWIWVQLSNGVSVHFWFVYLTLEIYLLLPFMKLAMIRFNNRGILVLLIFWFVCLVVKFFAPSTFIPDNHFTYLAFFLGYPLLGYFLATIDTKSNIIALAVGVVGIFITAAGTYYQTLSSGFFTEGYYSFLSPQVALVASSVFLLVKRKWNVNNKINIISNPIAKFSYGIYLVHILVLWLLGLIGISWRFIHPIWGVLFTSGTCLLLSIFIIFVVQKLPYGKYFSG